MLVESSAGGHTDVAAGIYDRPGPGNPETAERFYDTHGSFPIVPAEMVATQLATERPAIDDPDFIPGTTQSLALAVGELAKTVPHSQVEKFYRRVQDLVEKMVAEGEDENMSESNLRKRVAAILREAVNKAPDWTKDLGDENGIPWWVQKEFNDEFEPEAKEEEEVVEPAQEEYSLEDISKEAGFAGPSGAKNFINKLMTRIKRFTDVSDDEFDAMIQFASGEYIDLLEESGLIDAEDAQFMMQNTQEVSTLPSFKYFLFHAFVLPAVKQIEKTSKKSIRNILTKMGVPRRVQDTVMNQLIGEVPRNEGLIRSRLQDEVSKGSLTAQKAQYIGGQLTTNFSAFQRVAQGGDNFAEVALQKYAAMNKNKLLSILRQASEDPDVQSAM